MRDALVAPVPAWVVLAVVVAALVALSVTGLIGRSDKPSGHAPAPATYFGGQGDGYFGKP